MFSTKVLTTGISALRKKKENQNKDRSRALSVDWLLMHSSSCL